MKSSESMERFDPSNEELVETISFLEQRLASLKQQILDGNMSDSERDEAIRHVQELHKKALGLQ